MKKRIFAVMWAVILAVMCGIVGAAEEQPEIKNLIFEIPDEWAFLTEESEDDVFSYYYKTENELMLIREMRYTDEYDESLISLYDVFVGVAAKGFEKNDGYISLKRNEYEIGGCHAESSEFCCEINGVVSVVANTSVNTGYSVTDFLYQRNLEDESIGFSSFTEMISNLQIGESEGIGEDNDSESNKYTKYSPSIYKVGSDIPAGEYVVFTEGRSGYFCVSSDSNQDDIIFNDNFDYNSIISVNDGEYLELSRCYAIPIEENPDVSVNASGMFKVGLHIPAGEYTLDAGGEHGYYCIYSDSRQDDIVSNDNFEGRNYVTVSDGQYLELSRCKFTEPPAKPE